MIRTIWRTPFSKYWISSYLEFFRRVTNSIWLSGRKDSYTAAYFPGNDE